MVDVLVKCRLCLSDSAGCKMYALFVEPGREAEAESLDDNLQLFEKVELCCGIEIRPEVNLPTNICVRCFDMTRMWYNFRKMCINTQTYLDSLKPESGGEFNNEVIEEPILFADDEMKVEYLVEDDEVIVHHINQPIIQRETDDTDTATIDPANHDDINRDAAHLQMEQYEENEYKHDADFEGSDEFLEDLAQLATEDVDVANRTTMQDNDTEKDTAIMEEQENDQHLSDPNYVSDSESVDFLDDYDEITVPCTASGKKKVRPKTEKTIKEEKPTSYMCNVCGNVYNKRYLFNCHMKQHVEIKAHICEICNKAFRQLGELRAHIKRHSGIRPFKCGYCDRHFIDRSEKRKHERLHTNVRPFVCGECGKAFAVAAILRNHLKTHTGEKNFICNVCDKSFALQHQLKAHQLTLTHKHKVEQQLLNGSGGLNS